MTCSVDFIYTNGEKVTLNMECVKAQSIKNDIWRKNWYTYDEKDCRYLINLNNVNSVRVYKKQEFDINKISF